jgi:hypothetical protein
MRFPKVLSVVVLAFLSLSPLVGAQPYQTSERTLLLDHLDETFTPDGAKVTAPAVIKADGAWSGGRILKGPEFVSAKFGNGLQFRGLSKMDYPVVGNIDLSAGTLDFWVALNFDAEEVSKKPGKLSNQSFWILRGPGRSTVSLYSTLNNTCFIVYDKDGNQLAYGNAPGYWKKGEWHHLELRWGTRLELWIDGEMKDSEEWSGLLGPLDIKLEELRMSFGSPIGWSDIHSEYTLDEIRIQGPGGTQMPDRPLFTLPRITAPKIDGVIDDAEWARSARMTNFVGLNDNVIVEDQTIVQGGYDDEALYFSFECLDPQKRPLVTRATGRDGQPYSDDAIDIFLQPGEDKPYYHLVANAAGAIYDARSYVDNHTNFDTTFNPDWTVKTSQQAGRWVLECKIPFKELDGMTPPKDGERWRVNFCRDADGGARLSSWSFMNGNFHRKANFGAMIFSGSDRSFRATDLGDYALGKVEGRIAMTGFSIDPLVTIQTKITGTDGKAVHETENRLADYRSVNIAPPTLVTGTYTLAVRASTEKGDVFYQRLPFRVIKPYDISVAAYPYEGKLWVTSNVAGLGADNKKTIARSQLLQGDKVLGTTETSTFVRGIGNAAIDISQLPPGKYIVRSIALAEDSKELAQADAEFEQFAKPDWWRSAAGTQHTVPVPWTPVRYNPNGTLGVLHREYRVGAGVLPQQVVVGGKGILAAPITLNMKSGGSTADLARLPAKKGATFPDAVTQNAVGNVGNIKVDLQSKTEFDGMQIFNLKLTPNGAAQVDNLVLEIPIKNEFAKFILPSTGVASKVVEVGKESWNSVFIPQVWVGNDDVGYGWFAESDQYWKPRDDKMLEVVREGDRTFIRCKMVREAMTLNEPATMVFGLMATPVKAVPNGDPFLHRFGNPTPDHEKTPIEYLRYPGAGNFDPKAGTAECWVVNNAQTPDDVVRQVFHLRGAGGGLNVTSIAGKTGQRFDLIVSRGATKDQVKEQVAAKDLDLKPGEWAHVAVTWNSEKTELFVNGKSYGIVFGLPAEVASEPAKMKISFGTGDGYYEDTNVTIDEIRVSKTRRYGGEYSPPDAPFALDEETLLLDHLDAAFVPDGEDAETRPAKISGQSNELGGVPSLGSSFVAGKFGKALRLPMRSPIPKMQFVRNAGADASLIWVWHEDAGVETAWPPPLLKEPKRPKLREIVREYNDAGLILAPYTAFPAIGAPTDWASQFGQEWSRRPISTIPYEPPKGHYFWDMCARSGFADYIAAGTKWTLDDLGFKSAYTDGLVGTYPCQNTHHGCGYHDEEGILHSTYPVFAVREMMKRMYRVIKTNDPKGIITNHQSFNTSIASLAFSDVHYSGEHEVYEDLLKFRVRWQGKHLGFWPILLGGSAHIYNTKYTTWCLVNGVSVLPNGLFDRNDDFRKWANLWQTYDKFGYRQMQWIPHYEAEAGLAKASDPNVKTSLYLKPGEKAVLVVGNLSSQVSETTVKLDLKKMKLKGAFAKNLLDERNQTIADGKLELRLRPNSFLLVEVH